MIIQQILVHIICEFKNQCMRWQKWLIQLLNGLNKYMIKCTICKMFTTYCKDTAHITQLCPMGKKLFQQNCKLGPSNKKWMFLLQVSVLDGDASEEVTYKQALANWLENKRPFQALDDPMITNSMCPF